MSQESEDRSDRSRWFGFAQLAAILVLILLALYFARAPDRLERQSVADTAMGGGDPLVDVIQPEPTAQALSIRLTGAVRLERRARVVSEVAGRVAWVSPKFTNGGSIAAGEHFVRIDPTEFELRVEAAEAAVREAQGRSEGALAKARAELKLAKLDLERTTITFPYDSRVVNTDVEVGELVGPVEEGGRAAPLGIVYRAEALQAEVPIELVDLESLDPVIGRAARLRVGSETHDAEVVRVSSIVAPKTRLATLFLKFSDEATLDSLPLPGMFVEAEIFGSSRDNVYVLPESVLREGGSVWVVHGGILDIVHPATLGRVDAGWVTEAFDFGQGVVVGTVPEARKGMAVAVSTSG